MVIPDLKRLGATERGRRTIGRVVFAGVGPFGADLLTCASADALADADLVILNSPEVLRALDSRAPHPVRLRSCAQLMQAFDDPDDEQPLSDPRSPALDAAIAAAAEAKTVVWLCLGDPLSDGRVAPLAKQISAAELVVEIQPGVPRAQGTAAYVGADISARVNTVLASAATNAPEVTVIVGCTADDIPELASQLPETTEEDAPAVITWCSGRNQQGSFVTTVAGLANVTDQIPIEEPLTLVIGAERAPELDWFEDKPLFGWRILVPRTRGEAGALEARLSYHGATVEVVPTMAIEPPRNTAPMERAVHGLVDGSYQWVVFTTVNAVRAVLGRFRDYGLDARSFSGIRVAATDQAAVEALIDFGVHPDLVPGERTAAGLAAEFPFYDDLLDPLNCVLVPKAEVATDDLVASLGELGWEVEEVTVFRAVRAAPPEAEIREAIKTGGYDAVCFTSSSTVRNLVGIAGKPHAQTVIATIGPASADTAAEHGLVVEVISPVRDDEALADALATFAREDRAEQLEAKGKAKRPSQRVHRRARKQKTAE